MLTGAGGLIGVLVGVGLAAASSWILRWLLGHWTLFIEPWALFGGLLASVLTGIAFGLYPALRAAHVDVVDALRSE